MKKTGGGGWDTQPPPVLKTRGPAPPINDAYDDYNQDIAKHHLHLKLVHLYGRASLVQIRMYALVQI